MKEVKIKAKLWKATPGLLEHLERCGRVCYQSESGDNTEDFVRGLIKKKHHSVLEHASFTFYLTMDRGCCYDDQTKVLTQEGWKLFKDCKDSDVFYTKDEKDHLVFVWATELIQRPYTGKMHQYASTQINLCVTPDHNMWVYDYNKRSPKTRIWKFLPSKEATNEKYTFSKSATPSGRTTEIPLVRIDGNYVNKGFYTEQYPDRFFDPILFYELLGWWVTDGSVSYGTNGSGSRLVITQTKEKGRERIQEILKALELEHTVYDTEFRINWPPLLVWIADRFIRGADVRKSYYVSVPRSMFHLPVPCLAAFLTGVIGGNGSKHTGGEGYQIYTASYAFAESLVELCLCVGKCANIYKVSGRDRLFPNGKLSHVREQYVLSIVPTTNHVFSRRCAQKTEVDYDGMVYCATLPVHHKLYVMRNGKACWCGNSHEAVRHRIGVSFSQESTRFCNYMKERFGKQIKVIRPPFAKLGSDLIWKKACEQAEKAYFELLERGESTGIARSVLPTCLATKMALTMNVQSLRHFLQLRTAPVAHVQMQSLARQMYLIVQKKWPVLVEDIELP